VKSLSPPSNLNQNVKSSSSQSLTESSSDVNIKELGKSTLVDSLLHDKEDNPEKKLKELLEESQLFLVDFTVKHMSLEIHSRGICLKIHFFCRMKFFPSKSAV
jgi:hypothetical protein